ncbi:ABC transporter substrate-binding protein [Alteromonas sp. ASW11-36]|uniref:ABC transporter substrate-binding protein n=1 Tax=Alteromonas arenosi TaxID=3055817 RepID=A0ABT7T0P0_9ALTE|nr:ABC transporter substrate-binding protein [Alteromonas sp. ASW11-36]MDM7862013.1 ABC transporter substrate-binding protein [Alteromonas sp. ASW11-36]
MQKSLFRMSLFAFSFCLGAAFLVHAEQQEPFIIGLDADMSAVAAEGGTAIFRGASLAIEEINQAGGLLGRQISLVVKDHRGNPARGLRNLAQLSEEPNLLAVIGGVHTPVVLQELDLIHQKPLIFLVPWAAGTAIIDNGFEPNYVFRVSVRDSEAASVILSNIKRRGVKRVALILERTGWGRSNEKSMEQVAAKLGIDIVATEWINWRQQAFDEAVTRIADSDAEAVVMVANAPEGAVAATSLFNNRKTQQLPIVSHWGIAGGKFAELLGLDILTQLDLSVLQTFHFQQANNPQLAESLLARYRSSFDAEASPKSIKGQVGLAHAYDLIHMLAQAVETAQSSEPKAVRDALQSLQEHQGLIKTYVQPFVENQDALWASDYILTTYDVQGDLIPRPRNEAE